MTQFKMTTEKDLPQFNGDTEAAWREYKVITLAHATEKGWEKALTKDRVIPTETQLNAPTVTQEDKDKERERETDREKERERERKIQERRRKNKSEEEKEPEKNQEPKS